jgi:hypothetical protein
MLLNTTKGVVMIEYEYDAKKLSKLLEEAYGYKFDVYAEIPQNQRKIIINVSPISPNEKPLARSWCKGEIEPDREILQVLMNDLCTNGELKAGKYLLKFDD